MAYDVRISEKIIGDRSRCSFIPDSAHEVKELILALPKVPRYVADNVMRVMYPRMIADVGLLNVKNLGKVVLPHDECWVEFFGDRSEFGVLPGRAGVMMKKISSVEPESSLAPIFDGSISYVVSAHVVGVADIPNRAARGEVTKGFMFDPFRILVPVDNDDTAKDFAVEMLVDDEGSKELLQDVTRSSSRVVSLALLTMTEMSRCKLTAELVEPPKKFARTMAEKKTGKAILMPHAYLRAQRWEPPV